MATEVKLKPGWLSRDTQRAADRVHQWSGSRNPSSQRSERQETDHSQVPSPGQYCTAESDVDRAKALPCVAPP
jgi:hypothetical protein